MDKREYVLKVWEVIIAGVSAIAAIVTIVFGVVTFKESTRADFQLKMIEAAMNGSPGEAKDKFKALAKLFPDQTDQELMTRVETANLSWGRDSKDELLRAVAAQSSPEQRQAIYEIFGSLFPDDTIVKTIGSALPQPSSSPPPAAPSSAH
jgi:hypothetical protein